MSSPLLERIKFPPLYVITLIFLLNVFLFNRFDVPYSWYIGTWQLTPLSVVSFLLCLILFIVYRDPRGIHVYFQTFRYGWLTLGTWFMVALVSTLVNPLPESINLGGLGCLLSILLWMSPVFLISGLNLSKDDCYLLFIIVVMVAILGVLYASLYLLLPTILNPIMGWNRDMGQGRAFLPLGVATVTGVFFLFLLPLPLAISLSRAVSKKIRILSLVSFSVLVIGIISCGSRASILFGGILGILSLYILEIPWKQYMKNKLLWVGLLLTFLVGLGVLNDRDRLLMFKDRTFAWRARGIFSSIAMFWEKPILGQGIERYYKRNTGVTAVSGLLTRGTQDVVVYKDRLTVREPHNAYLLLLSETGMIGFICFVGFLVFILSKFQRIWRIRPADLDGLILRGIFLGVMIVMIHSLTESLLLARPRFAVLFWITLGVGLRFSCLVQNEKARSPSQSEIC